MRAAFTGYLFRAIQHKDYPQILRVVVLDWYRQKGVLHLTCASSTRNKRSGQQNSLSEHISRVEMEPTVSVEVQQISGRTATKTGTVVCDASTTIPNSRFTFS